MTTIVLERPGQLSVVPDVAPTAPGPGEALVRTLVVGVCGTDLHAFHGRQPFFTFPRILGHEVGVEVVAVGPGVTGVKPGDRCAIEPYLGCGTCIACRRGRPNCCSDIRVLGVHADGALRPQLTLPAAKLHVANDLDAERLALVETLVIGAHAVRRAGIDGGDTVLVCGAGPIGLAAMQAARAAGARVVVLDREPVRRERAAAFGAHLVLAPGTDGPATEAAIQAACGGDLPTAVIDATGNPEAMNAAFRYPCHGGRLLFVGLHPGDVVFKDQEFHRRELTLFASRNGTAADFAWVIAQLRTGTLDAAPWITHRLTPAELPGRMAALGDPANGCLKAVVRFAD